MIGARRLIWILLLFDSILTQSSQVEICTDMPFLLFVRESFPFFFFFFFFFSIDKNKNKYRLENNVISLMFSHFNFHILSAVKQVVDSSARLSNQDDSPWFVTDEKQKRKITIEWFHFSLSLSLSLSLLSRCSTRILWVSWDWKKKRIHLCE